MRHARNLIIDPRGSNHDNHQIAKARVVVGWRIRAFAPALIIAEKAKPPSLHASPSRRRNNVCAAMDDAASEWERITLNE